MDESLNLTVIIYPEEWGLITAPFTQRVPKEP